MISLYTSGATGTQVAQRRLTHCAEPTVDEDTVTDHERVNVSNVTP